MRKMICLLLVLYMSPAILVSASAQERSANSNSSAVSEKNQKLRYRARKYIDCAQASKTMGNKVEDTMYLNLVAITLLKEAGNNLDNSKADIEKRSSFYMGYITGIATAQEMENSVIAEALYEVFGCSTLLE